MLDKMAAKLEKLMQNRWIILLVCIACLTAGGLYNFGIQSGFIPNSEDIGSISAVFIRISAGIGYSHHNILYDSLSYLSYRLGGMTFFATRLLFTLLYVVEMCFTLFLCLRKDKKWDISYVPLFAFFVIFIHTIDVDKSFGIYVGEIRQLPYNHHLTAIINALICFVILQIFLNTQDSRKRKILAVCEIVAVIYGFRYTDIIFISVFLAPLLLILFIRGLYSEKTRRYVLGAVLIGLIAVLITRVIPLNFFEKLWRIEPGGYYSGVYGSDNWVELSSVLGNVNGYIRLVMLLFNIEISNRPYVSLYSLLFVVRILFLIAGYIIVFRIVKRSILGKIKESEYDILDELLAWSYVVVSCSFIFTRFGSWGMLRYYVALVPIMTILLCRNLKGLLYGMFPDIMTGLRHKKLYFFAMMGILCICQAEPLWQYEATDCYVEDCEKIVEYVRENDLEYAIAPYWWAARLTAMTDGEIIFYGSMEQLKACEGEDAGPVCVIAGYVDNDSESDLYAFGVRDIVYDSYEEMCEKFATPTKVLHTNRFGIFIFDF